MLLILDTSVVLAALDSADPDHQACANLLNAQAGARVELVMPSTVLVELDYWISERLDPTVWRAVVHDLVVGAYRLEQVTLADIVRASDVDAQYAALGLGLVDSSLVALAERLGQTKLATLNLRDFRPVVPRHCPFLELLPADLP